MGLGSIPASKPGCLAWLAKRGIKNLKLGKSFHFRLADLPKNERYAYLEQSLKGTGNATGVYDEAAHDAFFAAPNALQDDAHRKAEMVLLLQSLGTEVGWSDRIALVQDKFGVKGTSQPRLKRLLKAVKGVDPINFGPALLPAYKGRTAKAAMSEYAWDAFLAIVKSEQRIHTH